MIVTWRYLMFPVSGMGYPSLARGGIKPIFNQMMDQGVVDEPLFSFWISKNRTSKVTDPLDEHTR